MKRIALAALVTLSVACSAGSSSVATASLPAATCALLHEPIAGPLRTVEQSLYGFTHHGSVDVIVYMKPIASDAEVEAVRATLSADPSVKSMTYLDHDAAFSEFQSLFSDNPSIGQSLTPAETPTSFKIALTDVIKTQPFRESVSSLPGVYNVIDPVDSIHKAMVAAAAVIRPKLDALLQSGGSAALVDVVREDQQLYAALEQDSSAPLYGPGGVLSNDQLTRLTADSDTLRSEISRDCKDGASS